MYGVTLGAAEGSPKLGADLALSLRISEWSSVGRMVFFLVEQKPGFDFQHYIKQYGGTWLESMPLGYS